MSRVSLRSFFESEFAHLYQESVIQRFLGRVQYRGWHVFPDDRVKALNGRPLGMFFYNLRAIFLGFSLIFLCALGLWASQLPPDLPSVPKIQRTLVAMALAWLASTVLTLYLHKQFVRNLSEWAQQRAIGEFPLPFIRYFILDSCIIMVLVVAGEFWDTMGHDLFAFILFANVVVYSAYFPTVPKINRLITVASFLLVVTFLFVFAAKLPVTEPRPFLVLLYAGPLLGMAFVVLLSILTISRLRTLEHRNISHRFKLLGDCEDKLSIPDVPGINQQQFGERAGEVLKDLCTLGDPFWYRSACLWLVERHQDRGELFLPETAYNFPEADQHLQGTDAWRALLRCSEEPILTHSLKAQQGERQTAIDYFRHGKDIPAAFVPLSPNRKRAGMLILYGEENGPPLQRQDFAFLKSLGSIVSNALERWEGIYRIQAQAKMDELFKRETLDDVFEETAAIMQEYLGAAGCMVIYRPDPTASSMSIKAKIGFSDSIFKTNHYEVGQGQTGECAAKGDPIRVDDVAKRRSDFDAKLLRGMERAHREVGGRSIVSWMAIPIGRHTNYGVIKVINHTPGRIWFSEDDQQLGLSLALRLQFIIEKFEFVREMKRAKEEAEANSREAGLQAEQRQEDLMVTMHQLQGPLAAMHGSISYLQKRILPYLRQFPKKVMDDAQEELEYLEDFIEDTKALSYGTFTTFALEVGRQTAFRINQINAPEELRRLARRLQRTNARPDLNFSFYEEAGFPILQMDKKVFTSVVYSLIHNAMKYADPHSEVSLICGTERRTGEPVLKVKSVGEPIQLGERDLIFEKFGRGRVVKMGRHHDSGVGLGLWVAKRLMEINGGDLSVELSGTNPRLSVFVVSIPVPAAQAETAAGAGRLPRP